MLCFNSKCGMNNSADMNDLYRDPMFNPMAQYEQAYCYYRYLCMQMDYKIKTGAPCRTDRVAKYNRLLNIENQLMIDNQ